jgi:hypothetical protein
MTVAREWAIPVALGLVVAAGLWAVSGGDRNGGGDPDTTPSATNAPAPKPVLLAPFATSVGFEGTDARFLLVAPEGQAAAMAFLNASGQSDAARRLEWTGGNAQRGIANKLAYYTVPHAMTEGGVPCTPGQTNPACPPGNDSLAAIPHAVSLPSGSEGPRLGLDGHNATRATLYVFDSRGLLAATNDEPVNWSRFPGAPTTMEPAVWYFGSNATAPNGTQKVPSFAAPLVQQMRPLMEGLPVGGVASAQSNAYVSLYGTLFITLRVDEIVYAP